MGTRWLRLGCCAILLGACAGKPKVETANLRESVLTDLNPAPKGMALPQNNEGEAVLIDPLYLQSQADYHFTTGETYSLEGRPEKAVEEFKLALVYDPSASLVRVRLASELFRQGLTTEALENAETAVRQNPKSIEGRMFLGTVYTSMKMYDQARSQYEEVVKLDPKHNEAAIFLGALLAEQKKYDEAIRHFSHLAHQKDNEMSYLAYYYLGRIWLEHDEKKGPVEAEKALKKSLEIRPQFEEGVLALSQIQIDAKREKEALKLLSNFQERYGPETRVAQKLSHLYLSQGDYDKALTQLEVVEQAEEGDLNTKMKITMINIQQKQYPVAIRRLQQILTKMPESDKVRFYLAAVYEEVRDFDSALTHFVKVPPTSTFFGEATIHSIFILKMKGRMDKAVQTAEESLELRPDVPQLYAVYASLLDEKRDYKTGVKMLSEGVERFPTNAQLRFFYGSMLDRVGEVDKSISELKQVLSIDANHAQSLNYLAYTYAEQGKELPTAEVWARKAVNLQPEDPYIVDTLGWVLFKQDRVHEAIPILEKAFRLKPDESVIAEHLGDAYYRFQLMDKARRMYKKAVESEKDESKARKLRDKLASTEDEREKRSPASTSPSPY